MNEKNRMIERFKAAQARGLVDVKFFVPDGSSLSEEDFCAAVNRIDDAIERGDCTRHSSWADVPTSESPLLRE